jgi:hypothetical protein
MYYYFVIPTDHGTIVSTIKQAPADQIIITNELHAFPTLKECLDHRLKYHSHVVQELDAIVMN